MFSCFAGQHEKEHRVEKTGKKSRAGGVFFCFLVDIRDERTVFFLFCIETQWFCGRASDIALPDMALWCKRVDERRDVLILFRNRYGYSGSTV